MFTSIAPPAGSAGRRGLAALLFGSLAALMLGLGGCGGGDAGTAGASPGTPPPAAGCDASSCGEVLVALTDADGDFLSYSVEVVSLKLRKANGAVVDTLPVRTRVDFAQLVDMTELVTAATIPNGTYVEGEIRLDYSNAEVTVESGGAPVEATVVDADGAALGVVDLTIRLDDRNAVVIGPGRPALLQLDFDLAATHTVDLSTTPATAVAEPFIVAGIEPVEEKELRVRGPLVGVDVASGSYLIDLRPFHHRDARLGRFTVNTGADTVFEIDGETFEGSAGLEALAQQGPGTRTVAFGLLAVEEREFTAARVHAGSSVPGPRFDVLQGNVIARDGDSLTVRGGTLIRGEGSVTFLRGDIEVLVGPETGVVRDGVRGEPLDEGAISVGQRIHAFGQATEQGDGVTLDATEGRVRLHLMRLSGTVVAAGPGQISLDLAAIDGRRPGIFDFAGTGLSPAVDADPEAYEIATGALDLSRLAAGEPARAFGFVAPFGEAPPDFLGRTVVTYEAVRAALGIGWGPDGTSAPFLSLGPEGLVVDNTNPDIGLRHHIKVGERIVDLLDLPSPVTIVSAEGRGLYSIGEPGRIEVFGDFARFTGRLAEKLSVGAKVRSMHAGGAFDPGSATLSAYAVNVALASTD